MAASCTAAVVSSKVADASCITSGPKPKYLLHSLLALTHLFITNLLIQASDVVAIQRVSIKKVRQELWQPAVEPTQELNASNTEFTIH